MKSSRDYSANVHEDAGEHFRADFFCQRGEGRNAR